MHADLVLDTQVVSGLVLAFSVNGESHKTGPKSISGGNFFLTLVLRLNCLGKDLFQLQLNTECIPGFACVNIFLFRVLGQL